MNCKNCGREVSPEEKFCENCGAKIDPSAAETPYTPPIHKKENYTEILGANPAASAQVDPNSTVVLNENPVTSNPADPNSTVVLTDTNVTNPFAGNPAQQSNLDPNSTVVLSDIPNYQPPVTDPPTPKPPKKGKKGLFIGIGLVAVIAVIAVAFPFLKNFFTRTFASNESYFKTVEKESVEKATVLMSGMAEKFVDFDISSPEEIVSLVDSKSVGAEISLNLSDNIVKYASENAGFDLSFIKNISLGYGLEVDGDNAGFDIALGLENRKLLSADAIVNLKDFIAYVAVPEISDTAMKLDIQKLTGVNVNDLLNNEEFNAAMDSVLAVVDVLPDSKTMSNIIMRYFDVILEQVETVEKKDREVTVGGEDSTYTELSTVFTPDDVEELCIAIIEEFRNDDEMWTVIEKIAKAIPEADLADTLNKEDFNKEYEENRETVMSNIDGSFDEIGNITYAILVNKKGDLVGREITVDNGGSLMFICNENGFELDLTEEGNSIANVAFDGNLFEDVCEGTAVLSLQGEELVNIKVEDMKSDGSSAKMTISPSKSSKEKLAQVQMLAPAEFGINLEELGINLAESSIVLKMSSNIDSKSNLGNVEYGIALVSDGTPVASIEANMDYSASEGITLPEKFIDIESEDSLLEWAATADIMGFFSTLPESISNILMDALLTGMS